MAAAPTVAEAWGRSDRLNISCCVQFRLLCCGLLCKWFVAAVLQNGAQTTTWQWTAPPGLTQLAEILVVAGEERGASLPCIPWLCMAAT
jgi:hypothetical protein